MRAISRVFAAVARLGGMNWAAGCAEYRPVECHGANPACSRKTLGTSAFPSPQPWRDAYRLRARRLLPYADRIGHSPRRGCAAPLVDDGQAEGTAHPGDRSKPRP